LHVESRILAIDYGENRIGLAVSDPLRIIASGIETIYNTDTVFEVLGDIIRKYSVVQIVLGLPLDLAGKKNALALRVEAFGWDIQSHFEIPVEYFDERFTSIRAEQTIRSLGVGRQKRRSKGKVDQLAAVHLLQDYLDRRRK